MSDKLYLVLILLFTITIFGLTVLLLSLLDVS